MRRQERDYNKKGKALYFNTFNGSFSCVLDNLHLAVGLQIIQLVLLAPHSLPYHGNDYANSYTMLRGSSDLVRGWCSQSMAETTFNLNIHSTTGGKNT